MRLLPVIIAGMLFSGAAAAHEEDGARFRAFKLDNNSIVIFDRNSGAFITCGVGVQDGIGYSYSRVAAPSGMDQAEVDGLIADAGNPVRAAAFDRKYGSGSARRVLDSAPRALGSLAQPAAGTCFGWRRPPGTE